MWTDIEKKRANKRRNSAQDRLEGRKLIIEAKSKPCMDCGKSYPYYVMDFDHRPDEEVSSHLKPRGRHGLDRLAGSRNLLIAEIAKCDVVCANCHRIRTWAPEAKSGEFQ